MAGMEVGFGGDVPAFYRRYRHGYPPPVIDAVGRILGLTSADLAIDLGCGTGQLTLPLAGRLRAVFGADPEPGMLAVARDAAEEQGIRNVAWLLAADTGIPALGDALGAGSVAALTVGQALHWMDHKTLFRQVMPLLRPGGGIAIVTNGTPLWQQDTDWSAALCGFLEQWLGTKPVATCGTSQADQDRYAEALAEAGYEVSRASHDYDVVLDLERVTGAICSALHASVLPPPDQRADFAARLGAALAPERTFTEHVHVAVLAGRRP
jgi:SAM-dependent methyltransferase